MGAIGSSETEMCSGELFLEKVGERGTSLVEMYLQLETRATDEGV